MNEQNLTTHLSKVVNFLKTNRKPYTSNMISKILEIDKEVVDLFLVLIEKLSYVAVSKSKSGRIITFFFNPYSSDVAYTDNYSCVMLKGKTLYGTFDYIKRYEYPDTFKEKYMEMRECAEKENLVYVELDLTTEQICEGILKVRDSDINYGTGTLQM